MVDKQKMISPPIIDVEASGFGPQSYPIEIGVILADDTRYCQLIRPAENWTHWDESAEAVHGIQRETLFMHGLPAEEVARNLNEVIQRTTVFSDAWVVDLPWIRTLFWSAQIEMQFSVSPLETILREPQMAIWHETRCAVEREMHQPRHRASVDALVIRTTFEKTLLLTQNA